MPRLQISDRRERALVAAADRALSVAAALGRPLRRRRRPATPARILLLRIERIGDLLMALPAVADVRSLAPLAEIDLVVGSWNADLARAITGITRVEIVDAHWLARDRRGLGLSALLGSARAWRRRRYDLAVNFEPDVRSNLLLAAAGAGWTAGYRSGGGGPLLDVALDYDTATHTTANARRLVESVFGRASPRSAPPSLEIPDAARAEARTRLAPAGTPLVGVHVSGGREIKQWPPERFAAVAERLIAQRHATIVLTGAPGDRELVERVRGVLPPQSVIDASGQVDLLTLAAMLERFDLFVTGDTGPMHLASTMGTPIVAVFGPSDPARYAPTGPLDRIVRVDLPCSPCNRIRLPPARCVGHTPDCLAGVTAEHVTDAAIAILDRGHGSGVRGQGQVGPGIRDRAGSGIGGQSKARPQ
jgi:ADP-heptose:LPS heptosyltransferase